MRQILIVVLFFFLLPMYTGTVCTKRIQKNYVLYSGFCYVAGFVIMLGIFQFICIPMILAKQALTTLTLFYLLILGSILFIATWKNRCLFSRHRFFLIKRFKNPIWCVIALLIAFQIGTLCFYSPYIYGDDKTYISMVNDMVDSNTLVRLNIYTAMEMPEIIGYVSPKYILTSYFPFLAMIAKLGAIHPLILCKTIMPFIVIPAHYMVIWMLGKELFARDEKKQIWFLFWYLIVNMCGCFSWYTVSFRVLTWLWQGKAILAGIIIPFYFYFLNIFYKEKASIWEWIMLGIIVSAGCAATLMGAGLLPLMGSIYFIGLAIYHKKICYLLKGIITLLPALSIMGGTLILH